MDGQLQLGTKCPHCGVELQGIVEHASHMCAQMREESTLYFIGKHEVSRSHWEAFNKAMQTIHQQNRN